MALGFNKVANKENQVVASTIDMRAQIVDRLDAAYKRLNPANSFANAAGRDEGLMGGLFLNLLALAVLPGALQAVFAGNDTVTGLIGNAADPTLCAAFEAVAFVADERANSFRNAKSAMYPKGRKQGDMGAQPPKRKFNLVAANQNYRFQKNASNEIACMAEMLHMLDKMEKDGVTAMHIDMDRPLYDTLKENEKLQKQDSAVKRFAMPVRKFA